MIFSIVWAFCIYDTPMSNPKMSAVEKSLFDEMGPKIDGSSETMVNNTLSHHTIVNVSLRKSF